MDSIKTHAHWLLRLALASVFIFHGLGKFLDLGAFSTMMSLSTPIAPVMLGAIVMVHWGQWSFMASDTHPAGGMEFQVVLLLIAVYFAITGNGAQKAQ